MLKQFHRLMTKTYCSSLPSAHGWPMQSSLKDQTLCMMLATIECPGPLVSNSMRSYLCCIAAGYYIITNSKRSSENEGWHRDACSFALDFVTESVYVSSG